MKWSVPFLIVMSTSAASASDVDTGETIIRSQTENVLGRATGATVDASAPEGLDRLKTASSLVVLGKVMKVIQATALIGTTASDSGRIEYYSFGKRIFSDNAYFKNQGFLQASAGINPVEVRVPVIRYPVGPLVLSVDGGVRFQAAIDGKLQPTIWVQPLNMSTVNAKFEGTLGGDGFVEGYGQLIVVRGGVGGDVELVDGKIDLDTMFFFNGTKPDAHLSTLFKFFYGKFYAFADAFNPFGWRWKRFWDVDLYSWKGRCVDSGKLKCTN